MGGIIKSLDTTDDTAVETIVLDATGSTPFFLTHSVTLLPLVKTLSYLLSFLGIVLSPERPCL